MTDDECNFKEKLRKLCDEYDDEAGEYPESQYQGRALYDFYLRAYHPETADAEIEQYHEEKRIQQEESADKWFSSYTEEERERLIRDGFVDKDFLEKYNKKHGTDYKYIPRSEWGDML